MRRYLHKFDTNEQRSQYENWGGGYVTPYTSLVYEDDSVHYNVFKAQLTLTNERVIIIPQKGNNTDSALTPSDVSAYKENLVDIIIGDRIKTITQGFLESTINLKKITISNSVETISPYTFRHNDNLSSVVIGNKIKNIGGQTFRYCGSLISVTVLAKIPPTLGGNAFFNNAKGRKFYVPQESVDAYKTATSWSTYASSIEPIPTE